MKGLFLTASWDDGHPLDEKLADLLDQHNVAATFYVPGRNQEGLPVLTTKARRYIDERFEVGSHTLDHMPLDGSDANLVKRQVTGGKLALEDQLGHEVNAFCYPGGRNTALSREIVRQAGFNFARTTADFNVDPGINPYLMPVSVQFKPRSLSSFAFNFLKWGDWMQRSGIMLAGVRKKGALNQAEAMFEVARKYGGVFHLWGHSWEIEAFGGWGALDQFLQRLTGVIPAENRLTNGEVFSRFYLSDVQSTSSC